MVYNENKSISHFIILEKKIYYNKIYENLHRFSNRNCSLSYF